VEVAAFLTGNPVVCHFPLCEFLGMVSIATGEDVALNAGNSCIYRSTARRWASTSSCWMIELTYTYMANGGYYSGFHFFKARNRRRAEELASSWKGRIIVLRYSPAQYEISVALKSDQPGGWSLS
jgi:hypothetical protein